MNFQVQVKKVDLSTTSWKQTQFLPLQKSSLLVFSHLLSWTCRREKRQQSSPPTEPDWCAQISYIHVRTIECSLCTVILRFWYNTHSISCMIGVLFKSWCCGGVTLDSSGGCNTKNDSDATQCGRSSCLRHLVFSIGTVHDHLGKQDKWGRAKEIAKFVQEYVVLLNGLLLWKLRYRYNT